MWMWDVGCGMWDVGCGMWDVDVDVDVRCGCGCGCEMWICCVWVGRVFAVYSSELPFKEGRRHGKALVRVGGWGI